VDNKLLMRLFKLPSQSGCEDDMISLVCKELDAIGIEYEVDSIGNIFNISQSGKPLLSAHLDTVQEKDDVKMADFIRMKEGYIKGNGIIGGDDKCGVYIILYLLSQGDEFNFVFSVQEETGGQGINQFTLSNRFDNIPYGLVLDRKGNTDVICTKNEYGIEEFENVLLEIGGVFGYTKAIGTWSDADIISDYISCANISVGYYNAHTVDEYVSLNDLQKSVDFVHNIIKNVIDFFDAPNKSNYVNYSKALSDKTCDLCNRDSYKTHVLETVFGITVCDECLRSIQWEVNSIVENERTTLDAFDDEYYGSGFYG